MRRVGLGRGVVGVQRATVSGELIVLRDSYNGDGTWWTGQPASAMRRSHPKGEPKVTRRIGFVAFDKMVPAIEKDGYANEGTLSHVLHPAMDGKRAVVPNRSSGGREGDTGRSSRRTAVSGKFKNAFFGQALVCQNLRSNVQTLAHQPDKQIRHADAWMIQLMRGSCG